MSCLICAEDYNASRRCQVSCPYCSFEACRTCCQTYILDQEATICMNNARKPDGTYVCRKQWTREFVTNTFPKTWVANEWKNMNAKNELEREKALLPATMAVVEQRRELESMRREVIDIEKEIRELNNRRWNIRRQIEAGGSVVTTNANSRGRKCPDPECRGYLSNQWKCGLCDKWTCPDCHVIKGSSRDAEHTCDPDTKATAQLLARDTKPCPKCCCPIHKIEGCDQMWCTQCHVAFSWRRGTIETRIHNPHYYEWQRQLNGGTAPRNIGDFECGRDLGDGQVGNYINHMCTRSQNYSATTPENREKLHKLNTGISSIIRKTIHLQEHDALRFQTDNVADNLEIRIKYLLGDITEKQFSSKVHAAAKATEKKRDIANVIQLQVQGITDIIYRIADVIKTHANSASQPTATIMFHDRNILDIIEILKEVSALTDYSNSILQKHAATYNCKVWKLSYDHLSYKTIR